MIQQIRFVLQAKSCATERGLAFGDVLNSLSGKWKMVLICTIGHDTMRFTAIQKLLPRITSRMLSKELKELELNEIIKRTVHESTPSTIEYSLTDSAKELVAIISELIDWGVRHRRQYSGCE